MKLTDRLGNLRAGRASIFCTERHICCTRIARAIGLPSYKAQGSKAAQKVTLTHKAAMEKRTTKGTN